ncbi:MAG: hypothetical protein ACM3PY_05325 [Omnitrophica WOR_2 bacterium]
MTAQNTIRCDFCGLEFDPACSQQSCNGCPISHSCTRIVCPRCGYPTLPEAKLVKAVRSLLKKAHTGSKQEIG